MKHTHVVHIERGLTSATARCRECDFVFLAVSDSHGGVTIRSGRPIRAGRENVVHVMPAAPDADLPRTA